MTNDESRMTDKERVLKTVRELEIKAPGPYECGIAEAVRSKIEAAIDALEPVPECQPKALSVAEGDAVSRETALKALAGLSGYKEEVGYIKPDKRGEVVDRDRVEDLLKDLPSVYSERSESVLPARVGRSEQRVGQEKPGQSIVEKCRAESLHHREMFAAAYLKTTNIPPEQAIFVEQRTEKGCEWFFKGKQEPDYEAILKEIEEYMDEEEYRIRIAGYAKVRGASCGKERLTEIINEHTPPGADMSRRSRGSVPRENEVREKPEGKDGI